MLEMGSGSQRVAETQVNLEGTNRRQVALDCTIGNRIRQVRDEELERRLGHRERRTRLMKESDRGAELQEPALARGVRPAG